MTSLPTIGGSVGTWASQLKAWLEVSHNDDGTLLTSAVEDSLGGSLTSLMGRFSVKDTTYGAKGDGTTNDTTAIQAAVTAAGNAYALDGNVRTVFFPSGAYKITSTITIPSGVYMYLGDATIDFSGVSGSFTAFESLGTMAGGYTGSTAIALTSNASPGDLTVNVGSSTGVNAGDWVQLSSTDVAGSTSQPVGEYVHVASTTSTTITFTTPICGTYTTAATGVVNKANPVEHVFFQGGYLKGPANTSLSIIGISLRWVRDFAIIGTRSLNVQNEHIELISSWAGRIHGCQMEVAELSGTAYGVSVGYCTQDVSIRGCTARQMRHFVTCGGGTSFPGIPRRITADSNSVFEALDAGLDCHPSGEDIVFTNNTIECVGTAGIGGNNDGIMFQGTAGVISGNTIRNVGQIGIHVQPLTNFAHRVIVANNIIDRTGQHGIYIDTNSSYTSFASIQIIGNTVRNADTAATHSAIQVGNSSGSAPANVVVNNNVISNPGAHGVQLVKATGGNVSGNYIEVPASGRGIYCNTSTASLAVVGNTFSPLSSSSTYGLYLAGLTNSRIIGNRVVGTAATGVVADSSCTTLVVHGNDFASCTTPYNISASATGVKMKMNIGDTAAQTSVTITSSPQTINNNGPRDVLICVSGGTVSLVEVSNDQSGFSTVATATGTSVYVPVGGAARVTYSSNPTLRRVPVL